MFNRSVKTEEHREALDNKMANNHQLKCGEVITNNSRKVEENEAFKLEHDYKHIKDFMTDYRSYENNVFNDGQVDTLRKLKHEKF